LKNIHSRDVLKKNASAYYRAVENIINLSCHKDDLLACMPHVLRADQYTIVTVNHNLQVDLHLLEA